MAQDDYGKQRYWWVWVNIELTTHFFYPFIQKKDFLVILIKFSIALVISEIEAYKVEGGSIKPSTIRISMGKVLEELSNEWWD